MPSRVVVLVNVTPSHVVLVVVVVVIVVVGASVVGARAWSVGAGGGRGVGTGIELHALSQQNLAPPGHPGALDTSISFVLPEAACVP